MRTSAENPRGVQASRRPATDWARVVVVLSCMTIGCAASGCGTGDRADRPTFPVRGSVFHEGRPAEGAWAFLHPAEDAGRREAWGQGYPRGLVRADGAIEFTTFAPGDGAPAGSYAVVVTWPERDADDDDAGAAAGEDRLAGRYADPARSPWKCVVRAPGGADLGRLNLDAAGGGTP